MPVISAGPNIESGTESSVPVTSMDYYPTLLELAGLPLRPEQHLDGQSFARVLLGGTMESGRDLFWHYPHYGNQGGSPSGVIRSGTWKFVEFFEADRPNELYNLAADPGEQRNLVDQEPERAAAFLRKLVAWRANVAARAPSPNPQFALPDTD